MKPRLLAKTLSVSTATVLTTVAVLLSTPGPAVAVSIFPSEPPSNCGGSTFSDVPISHTHYTGVCWVAANDITTNTGTYSPDGVVNRGSMATFLYRLAGSPPWTPPATSPYTDVPENHTHYAGITWLKAKGLTTETGTYSPSAEVNRGSMATFLYRLAGRPPWTPPVTSPYTDVPENHTHYLGITWLKAKGLTTETGTYSPSAEVNRGSMATFMYRFNKAGFNWPSATPDVAFGARTVGGYTIYLASSRNHTYAIASGTTAAQQQAFKGAMNYLGTATVLNTGPASSPGSIPVTLNGGVFTDVVFGNLYAWTGCTSALSSTVCLRSVITRNNRLSHPNEPSLFCHEIGHSVGLDHGHGTESNKDYPVNRKTCMRGSPDVSKYADIDIWRINQHY